MLGTLDFPGSEHWAPFIFSLDNSFEHHQPSLGSEQPGVHLTSGF